MLPDPITAEWGDNGVKPYLDLRTLGRQQGGRWEMPPLNDKLQALDAKSQARVEAAYLLERKFTTS